MREGQLQKTPAKSENPQEALLGPLWVILQNHKLDGISASVHRGFVPVSEADSIPNRGGCKGSKSLNFSVDCRRLCSTFAGGDRHLPKCGSVNVGFSRLLPFVVLFRRIPSARSADVSKTLFWEGDPETELRRRQWMPGLDGKRRAALFLGLHCLPFPAILEKQNKLP